MTKKYSLVFVAFWCSFFYGFGQGYESFTNLTATLESYSNGSYIGDNGVTWTYNVARKVTGTDNITGTSIGFGTTGTRYVRAETDENGVGDVTYSLRSYFTGGSATDRSIEVYVNGALYDSYTLDEMTTNYTRTLTANESGTVLIEFRSTGTRQIVVDEVSWTAAVTTPCVSPINQPSTLILSNITGSSIDGTFTATTADEYLVVVSTSNTLSGDPVNGTTYTNGDPLGGGNVVQSSNSNTLAANGLSPTTQYYFFVFALNDSSCAGGPIYNITNPITASETTITGPCASESFVNAGDDGIYGNINWIGDNGINWSTTDARSDEDLAGDEAILIRSNGNGKLSNDTSFTNGCGVISFNYARVFSGNSTLQVWINGSQYGGDINVNTTTSSIFSTTVNIPGNIDLEIRNVHPNTDRRALISNLSWTCYAGTPNPEIQLVDNTATNQNCGYTIDCGNVGIGSNLDLTFDIENNGLADLNITSFGITSDFIIVSPTAPFTITAGNSQTVTLRFTPTTIGTRTSILTINSNDIDEGSCTINLTGEGFTPGPEIDIERNTGGSIPTGSAPNNGFNTIFATTTIGNSTAPKTYHVSNEGTSNLSLTSIISSNPAEFSVSLNPGATIIDPSTEVDFEIIFSPTGVGIRTATITIASDDSDEGSYTFNVQGSGDCAAGSITLLPDNGPLGTIVTVTGSNFGDLTSATMNGTPVIALDVISSTEIEVTIPSGASTGSLEINDNLGCLSSALFIVFDNSISSCEGNVGITPTGLFISEVTDKGFGSHSYVEIYNGTGATISLNTYELRIHNNAATNATTTIPLSGSIANDGIIVIAFGGTNANDPEGGYTADFFSGGGGINEDDHIRLYDSTTWIDLWGDTSGNPFTIASNDYTYRRKNSGITAPSTIWDLNDWEAFAPVDYSNIGDFDFSLGVAPIVASGPNLSYSCNTGTISVTGSEGFSGGNSLTYQWYYSTPGELGWSEVPDNTIYNDVNTGTLDILDTSSLEGYQYYCQVREDGVDCYKASDAVQLRFPTTTWTSTGWSSPPAINKIAIINDNYSTGNGTNGQTSFEACSLIINAGNTLTVNNGNYVLVQKNVIVNGSNTDDENIIELIVNTRGSFVQVDDSGTFTLEQYAKSQVNKTTSPLTTIYNYTYWSSPVKDALIGTALFSANPNRLYYFDAFAFLDTDGDGIDDYAGDWKLANLTDIMEVGRGYASTHTNIGFVPGASYEYNFAGEFNTGLILEPLSYNVVNTTNHWNLVGNPYPSAIKARGDNSLFSENVGVIKPEVYMWSQYRPADSNNPGNQNLNFSQDDYITINNSGSVGNGGDLNGDGNVDIPGEYIPSGQSFFVSSLPPASNLMFNNAMRISGENTNDQFFGPNNSTQEVNIDTHSDERLWLNIVSDNGAANQLLVGYINGASDNFDLGYDTKRNLSANSSTIIYTGINDISNEKLVIQGKNISSINVDEVIPVGFKTTINVPTIFTFSLIKYEGVFLENNTVYLKDNILNKTHNLKESDYDFTSEVGEFNDRFEIVFTENALSLWEITVNNNSLQIIELQNGDVHFKLSSAFEMKSIEIVDLLGRTLYNLDAKGNSHTFRLPNLNQATYLAKVKLTNDYVITKKALKRK